MRDRRRTQDQEGACRRLRFGDLAVVQSCRVHNGWRAMGKKLRPEVCGREWTNPHGGQLDLPATLRSFLVTTNAIENLTGTSRRINRNVKCWRFSLRPGLRPRGGAQSLLG